MITPHTQEGQRTTGFYLLQITTQAVEEVRFLREREHQF
jgi:hypothetical protein